MFNHKGVSSKVGKALTQVEVYRFFKTPKVPYSEAHYDFNQVNDIFNLESDAPSHHS